MWLLIAFVTVPMIEIALFIQVGGWLTLWPTLGIVLLTGITGAALLRRQGLAVVQNVQRGLAAARNPLSPLAHGALILIAGLLLLTPGFLTDAVGFLLLIPMVRRVVLATIAARVLVVGADVGRGRVHRSGRAPGHAPDVIDGEWVDETAPSDRPQEPPVGTSGWTRH